MGDHEVLYVRNEKNHIEGARNDDDMWDDTSLILAYDHAVRLAKSEVEQRMNGVVDSQSVDSSDNAFTSFKHSNSPPKHSNSRVSRNKQRWSNGDSCRSIFTTDGIMYEADILAIRQGGVCTVRYVGYNNEEEVHLNTLQPSHGQAAREQQKRDSRQEMNCSMETSDGQGNVEPNVTKRCDSNRYVKSPQLNVDYEGPSSHRSKQRECSRSHHSSGHGSNFQPSPRQQQHPMSMPQMMVPPPPPLNLLASAGCPDDESEALSAMLMSWYMSGFHTGYYQGMKNGSQQVRPPHEHTLPRRRKH